MIAVGIVALLGFPAAIQAADFLTDSKPVMQLPTIETTAKQGGIKPPGPPIPFPKGFRELLYNFDRVEARLVEGQPDDSIKTNEELAQHAYGGFAPRSKSVSLTREQIDELRNLLTKDSPDIHEACIFHPNVSYQFNGPEGTLLVLLCHGCAEATFRWNGSHLFRNIDLSSNEELIGLASRLFPNEDILQRRRRK